MTFGHAIRACIARDTPGAVPAAAMARAMQEMRVSFVRGGVQSPVSMPLILAPAAPCTLGADRFGKDPRA